MIAAVKTGLSAVESGFKAVGKAGEAAEHLASAACHMARYLEVSAEGFARKAEQERQLAELEFADDLEDRKAARQAKLQAKQLPRLANS